MTEDHKSRFDRDGYLVLSEFFSPDQTKEMVDQMNQFERDIVPKLEPKYVFYQDKQQTDSIFRIEFLQQHHEWFDQIRHNETIVSLATEIMGEPMDPRQVEMFGKAPRIGQITPPHQDNFYWMLDNGQGCTFWLPIDPVDEVNGCIRYVPGSHRRGLRPHESSDTFGFSQGISDYNPTDERIEVPIKAKPGDLIVHHAMTIHRADANPSDRLRRALGLIYHAHSAEENTAAKSAYQKKLFQSWEKKGKL